MKLLLLAAVTLLGGFALGANPLDNAERAQAMLGPRIWSRVLKIDNADRRSFYDRTVYATVFELAGILWFYTDANGTQSLSLRRHDLVTEKADLGPLLLAIDPGFTRFEVVGGGASRSVAPDGKLLNGCFVESIAALRVRSEAGLPVGKPQLLAYYLPDNRGGRGHSVLTYEANNRLFVIDPATPREARELPLSAADDPGKLAARISQGPIGRTRCLTIRDFSISQGNWAGK